MHELAIADSLLDIALARARGRRVTAVGVVVGPLRQVVPSALDFAFTMASAGTLADGAALAMETTTAAGRCRDCGVTSAVMRFPLCCDACGGLQLDVVRGDELRVEWVELEEVEPAGEPPDSNRRRGSSGSPAEEGDGDE
jgi:hydrogenase nickel incorporation protein HypA/HybF